MDLTKHMALQNGSDIRGIAIATDTHPMTLSTTSAKMIANGIVRWLRQEHNQAYLAGNLTIGIGHDSRISGEDLAQAMIEQFIEQGVNVFYFGLATTPALFMSTQFPEFACDAGIMITASHLPFYYNGIKLFSHKGGAEHDDIEFILRHPLPSQNQHFPTVKNADLLTPYANDLVRKIRAGMQTDALHPLEGLKIIVDAGNGAGGFFAEKVLKPLGANTTGSQFLDPDGTFPNHIPNPDNKEAMASIRQAVLANRADLGIIFDTDVDRSAVVTRSGDVLNRNNLIALLSRIVLKEHPQTSIVTNSPTSSHLKTFIESFGGKQVRFISGYRNVINKAIALNEAGVDCQLAIETSGHAAFKENYFLDDGAYVIAKILMQLPTLLATKQPLESLIAPLKQPLETQEVRFKILVDDFRTYGQQVIEKLATCSVNGWSIEPENEEGIRVNLTLPFGSGWFLLRLSLHEPLLVLQIENDQAGFIAPVLWQLHQFFNTFEQIDQSALMAVIAEKSKTLL